MDQLLINRRSKNKAFIGIILIIFIVIIGFGSIGEATATSDYNIDIEANDTELPNIGGDPVKFTANITNTTDVNKTNSEFIWTIDNRVQKTNSKNITYDFNYGFDHEVKLKVVPSNSYTNKTTYINGGYDNPISDGDITLNYTTVEIETYDNNNNKIQPNINLKTSWEFKNVNATLKNKIDNKKIYQINETDYNYSLQISKNGYINHNGIISKTDLIKDGYHNENISLESISGDTDNIDRIITGTTQPSETIIRGSLTPPITNATVTLTKNPNGDTVSYTNKTYYSGNGVDYYFSLSNYNTSDTIKIKLQNSTKYQDNKTIFSGGTGELKADTIINDMLKYQEQKINRGENYSIYGELTNRDNSTDNKNISIGLYNNSGLIKSTTTDQNGIYEFTNLNSDIRLNNDTSPTYAVRVNEKGWEKRYKPQTDWRPFSDYTVDFIDFDPSRERVNIIDEYDRDYNLQLEHSDQTIQKGDSIKFTANVTNAYDVKDNEINYTWYVDKIKQPNNTKTLNYTFNQKGNHTIRVKTDLGGAYQIKNEIVGGNQTDNISTTLSDLKITKTKVIIETYDNETGDPISTTDIIYDATKINQSNNTSTWKVYNISQDHEYSIQKDGYKNDTDKDILQENLTANNTYKLIRNLSKKGSKTDDKVLTPTNSQPNNPLSYTGDYVLRITGWIINIGGGAIAGLTGLLGTLGGVIGIISVIGLGSLILYGAFNLLLFIWRVTRPYRYYRRFTDDGGIEDIFDL